MYDRERTVLDGDEAPDLNHDLEQSDGSYVRTLPAHVASCYNLQTVLLGCVIVVRNEVGSFELRGVSVETAVAGSDLTFSRIGWRAALSANVPEISGLA